MAQFVVTNCCFCFSLRAGTYIVSALSLVFSICLSVVSIYFAALSSGTPMLWVGVAIHILEIAMAVMLFYGVKNYRQRLIVTWVWLMLILMGLDLIFLILSVAIAKVSVLDCIFAFLILFIDVYLVIVARSYSLELTDQPLLPPP